MLASQTAFIYHDDREAQMLLERIKEKIVRKQAREEALKLGQSSDSTLKKDEQRLM